MLLVRRKAEPKTFFGLKHYNTLKHSLSVFVWFVGFNRPVFSTKGTPCGIKWEEEK